MNVSEKSPNKKLEENAKKFFFETFLPAVKKRDNGFFQNFNSMASLDSGTNNLFFDTWGKVAAAIERNEATVRFEVDDDECNIITEMKKEGGAQIFRSAMLYENNQWTYLED
jgi:hypothetical protein